MGREIPVQPFIDVTGAPFRIPAPFTVEPGLARHGRSSPKLDHPEHLVKEAQEEGNHGKRDNDGNYCQHEVEKQGHNIHNTLYHRGQVGCKVKCHRKEFISGFKRLSEPGLKPVWRTNKDFGGA